MQNPLEIENSEVKTAKLKSISSEARKAGQEEREKGKREIKKPPLTSCQTREPLCMKVE